MSRQTRVKNKMESCIFIEYSRTKKSKYGCHSPFHPSIFCRHSLQLLSPTLPKLMNWILLSPPPLSSDPDTPSKFGTCTKCHLDSFSVCYFCYSQLHIVSSNPHINDEHFWKEQDNHTSRNEHCMTPKQALLAPSLH